MSTYSATEFMRSIREDKTLQTKLATQAGSTTLEAVVALGSEAGFTFTAQDLRAAYRHDWELRWMRYRSKHHFKLVSETPATPTAP